MLKIRLTFALAALMAGGMTTFVTVAPQPANMAPVAKLAGAQLPVMA